MLTIDRIKDAVTKIGKKYGIESAYLFGSYAKNTATDDSDVDILIEKGKIHTYREYYYFKKELEDELGTSVDVLDYKAMFPGFFEIIKNDRIPLYGF
ncbi:nucleotidyltransferase domain-containing protein [Candidatus Saccharibacteria bacterium]|nr:nucleotidyltransferase domain-containing protein [Candidatus Saccharibacteria bacterium]